MRCIRNNVVSVDRAQTRHFINLALMRMFLSPEKPISRPCSCEMEALDDFVIDDDLLDETSTSAYHESELSRQSYTDYKTNLNSRGYPSSPQHPSKD